MTFSLAAAVLAACVFSVSGLVAGASGAFIATGLFLISMALILVGLILHYPHKRLGACNMITQVRTAIVAVLTVPLVEPEVVVNRWEWIFALAVVAFALDGVDGWLARRAGLISEFGGRFDVEVDTALAAVLSLNLVQSITPGTPTLLVSLFILGFTRYAFVLASWIQPWLAAEMPQRLSRKAVCVVQIGTLVAALLIPVTGWPIGAMMPVAAGLVVWSFARDILWLAQQRR